MKYIALRRIRRLVDKALRDMSPQFDALYPSCGRPSIPPERLLRALLLQVLFSVRSERELMSSWTTTCCFDGSSGSASTTACGIPRRSRRIEAGCSIGSCGRGISRK